MWLLNVRYKVFPGLEGMPLIIKQRLHRNNASRIEEPRAFGSESALRGITLNRVRQARQPRPAISKKVKPL